MRMWVDLRLESTQVQSAKQADCNTRFLYCLIRNLQSPQALFFL